MHQRTGSVYLDAPASPSRKPVVRTSHRVRSTLAATCVVVGLLALTASALAAGLRVLVIDPGPATAAFDEVLDDETVRAELEAEIARGIEEDLIGEELTAIAAAFELDVAAEATRLAPVVLDDEGVREALRATFRDFHTRVIVESDGSAVSLAALTREVTRVIEAESPRMATIVPAGADVWSLDVAAFPDISIVTETAERVTIYSLLPVLLIPLGLLVHPARHRLIAGIGHWALGVGFVAALAAVGLPYLGGGLTGLHAVELAIRAISLKLLAPAALAGIVGVGFVALGAALKRRDRRQVADQGAAVALGYDEPPLPAATGGPTLDLSARGLVDVNHPLTNI